MDRPRLFYLDNLRIALTFLVILHHAVEPWATGGGAVPVEGQSLPLAVIMGINASFFMGLFFFLAGYFSPSSVDHKGTGRFTRDRLLRLGLPAMTYAFVINPIIRWILQSHLGRLDGGLEDFWFDYLAFFFSYAHLWFVLMLLQLSLAYALWRGLRSPAAKKNQTLAPLSTGQAHRGLLIITGLLFAATFCIRIWWPQDEWLARWGLIQLEPAHLPQYLLLFVLGCMAQRNNWLERLPARIAWFWLVLGLLPTLALSPFMMERAFLGSGFSLDGLASAFREAFSCVGICCGLLVWFKGSFNHAGARPQWFSRRAYTAYIVQFIAIYLVQCQVRTWNLGAFASAMMSTIFAMGLTWILAGLVIKLPGLRRVL